MSCYTEGYITGITIKKGETPGKAEALSFEAVAPCRVRIDETDFGLFIDENGDKQLKDGKIAGALISHVPDSVKCEGFDAQVLLVLKQAHSKVRFVLNDELKVLERIVAM